MLFVQNLKRLAIFHHMFTAKAGRKADIYFTSMAFQIPALAKYASLIESHIPALAEETQFLSPNAHPAAELYEMFVDSRLLVAMRPPLVLSLWAIYESGVCEISEALRTLGISKDSLLTLTRVSIPIRNRTFTRVAKWFFHAKLQVSLFPSNKIASKVQQLETIRNILIHGNGVRTATKENDWKKLKQMVLVSKGLDVSNNYLQIAPEYLAEQIRHIDEAAKHIVEAARAQLEQHGVVPRSSSAV